MVDNQSCFEIKEVGKNLDKEHNVFNLTYLVELFEVFYPEEFKTKKGKPGKKVKYAPKNVLSFILWGKNNNRDSSRELENWCDNNDESCQLVLDCEKITKDVIIRFKNDNQDLVNKFDQFLIDLGKALELIDGKILYADGTILKAWCNTFKTMYPYEIDYLKEFLKTNSKNKELWLKLQQYFINEDENAELKEELDEILSELKYNLNSSGIHLLKLSLESSEGFQKVLERIDLMEKNIDGENSISIIDPEARHMLNKDNKMGLNYNYQTVTDNKNGFRIAHYLTTNTNDINEAKRLVDITAERLHTDNFIICMDNGYWNPDLLKEIYKGNTRVVMPDKAEAMRKKNTINLKNSSGKRQEQKEKKKKKSTKNKPKRIPKHEFKYLPKIDAFQCPLTQKLLTVVGIVKNKDKPMKKYTSKYCVKCEFKKQCTSQYKRTFYEHHDPVIEEIKRFYYSDEGQEIYFKRGHYAETSFAILKESRNYRGIKTKGLKKAENELTLDEIHHNIKKYEKLTTNTFLKLILNKAKKHKEKHHYIDFSFFDEFKGNYITKNNKHIGLRDFKKKQKNENKNNRTQN